MAPDQIGRDELAWRIDSSACRVREPTWPVRSTKRSATRIHRTNLSRRSIRDADVRRANAERNLMGEACWLTLRILMGAG